MSNHSMALVSAPTGLRAMGASLSKKIVSGPMAGFRWQLTSGGKLFRVLRGLYEPEQTQSFVREIKPGDCVFDIGSHVGWYALLSSRLVGDGGKVLAFEANPRNFWYLQRHVENNQLGDNVNAFHLGISDKQGELYFQSGTGTGTGFLAESGEVRVPTKPVDQLVDEHNAVPTHMKIDVEGGEVAVLEGARKTLKEHHPLIFLSTHGSEIKTQCMNYLAELGYTFESMDDRAVEQCADFVCRYKQG